MISQAQAYQEVYYILKNMDKKKVMKVPNKILEYIIDNRDKEYKTKIKQNDLLNPENIDDRTCNIISWINLNYWADEKERKVLNMILENNEIELEKEKNKRFSNEVFNNKTIEKSYKYSEEKDYQIFNNKTNNKIMKIQKETRLTKILKWIENIFIRRNK